jgi:hypothetical protein
VRQPTFMLKAFVAAKSSLFPRTEAPPDLGSQLEELLVEVWRQETFERKHPFTCAAIRQTSRPLQLSAPEVRRVNTPL